MRKRYAPISWQCTRHERVLEVKPPRVRKRTTVTSVIEPTAELTIPQHVLLRRVEDEMILLNLDSDEYFALDEVAARFVEILDPSGSIETAAKTITEEYDVMLDVVTADLTDLTEQLVDVGLLVLAG